MVLMPINPKKVKVGRQYFCSPNLDIEIVAIHKNGYKVKSIVTNRILPKLRQAEDLMLRRHDYMVNWDNPRER